MKLTSSQLRQIIAEEVAVVAEAAAPPVDLSSMSTAQLNALITAATKEKEARLAGGRKSRLEDALVPVDEPGAPLRAADEKRFVAFFTRRSAPGSKNPTSGAYAKTRSGILYKYDPYNRLWAKVEG